MQDQPTSIAMLAAIATLLRDELLPKLDGRSAFQARVAANALDIVTRELEQAPAVNAEESARLYRLLGETGDLHALNWALCRRISAGEMTIATPGLLDHLWRTTLDKLAIDQPNYATYRQVLEERSDTVLTTDSTNTEGR
jgi:Domain of unknown function (DUF6285)